MYRILDAVINTGQPVEIERNGRRLQIMAVELDTSTPRNLDMLIAHPGTVVGDAGDLVDIRWDHEWRP